MNELLIHDNTFDKFQKIMLSESRPFPHKKEYRLWVHLRKTLERANFHSDSNQVSDAWCGFVGEADRKGATEGNLLEQWHCSISSLLRKGHSLHLSKFKEMDDLYDNTA